MADICVDDKGQYYRVFIPTDYAEYIKRLLQHSKETYVEEFNAASPEEYWAHRGLRKDQVQFIIDQLT